MRGHLKQRNKGSWTIWLELPRDPATGKRQQKTLTIKRNKKEAEKKLAELQHQMDTGAYVNPSKMRVLDETGAARVLEAARSTEYYALFHFLLDTGARRSEALGLRWSDVDLLLCHASINRSMHQLRDGSIVFRQPKTARSRRMIALPHP